MNSQWRNSKLCVSLMVLAVVGLWYMESHFQYRRIKREMDLRASQIQAAYDEISLLKKEISEHSDGTVSPKDLLAYVTIDNLYGRVNRHAIENAVATQGHAGPGRSIEIIVLVILAFIWHEVDVLEKRIQTFARNEPRQ